jgi:ABC-type antimicrobial peptide transport system permease subunit
MWLIVKNLWRRKTRTLLTALGIAVGVGAVVSLSAFGEGFASGFESLLSSGDADLLVSEEDAMMAMLSAVDQEVGDELLTMPGVDDVAATIVAFVQMPDAPYFTVMGEDPRGSPIEHYRVISGSRLSGRKQILLGKITAQNFDKAVGETFRLNGSTFRVVGIFETGTAMQDGGAVISVSDAQRVFDMRGKVNYFNVNLTDPRHSDSVKQAIEERWPNLLASRAGEATSQTDATNMYRSFGWFLGLFAVLVGGLGMMNTSLMSVFERTREIGVLRAVGWRRRRVIGLILGETLAISLFGGLLGIGLGLGLTGLAQLSPSVQSLLQGVYTPQIFIQALVTALLLGTFGGLYPAWRASRLEPVEAMRYEGGGATTESRVLPGLTKRLGRGALRNLLRRPTRTLVTLAGLAIGVGFIVSMMSITEGFISDFTEMATAGQTDLLAEQANASDMGFSRIDERLAVRLLAEPTIRSVSRVSIGVSTAPGMPYFFVIGIDPREEYIRHYRITEGRLIERKGEIILGRSAATGLKKNVGEKLKLGSYSFRVVGIFENGLTYEDAGGTVMLRDAQQMLGMPRKVSLLGIHLDDPRRAGELAPQLEAKYPQLMISRASELTDRMQDIATTRAVLNALIGLTVIVGGIVMMNAMLMTVYERTQEIGVLRALGWRRRRVIGMILGEAIGLSMLSGIAGALLGVALNAAFALEPSMGAFLKAAYSPWLFLQTILLCLTLGVLGGLYPAWRAANLQPIEALRYE